MRRFPPAACLFPLLLLVAGPLSAAELRELKVLQDDTGTQAVLELQGNSDYKVFTLANPDRLVLDLTQSRLAPGFTMPPPNGAVVRVRTGKPEPGTLRIVFDLGASVTSHSRVEREGATTRLIVRLDSQPGLSIATAVAGPAIRSVTPAPASAPIADITALANSFTTITNAAPPVVSSTPPLSAASVASPVAASTDNPLARAPVKSARDMMASQRKLVVAIDAGHGGKDPGASGPSGVREKNITLAVARELARQINADAGMRAVLIRDGDTFVPLQQRYMKARSAQADLFISIHADASPNNSANGASVFVLSTRGASSQAARWLADKENAADLVGGVTLDQKDPNLAAVLLDLSQSATMRASDDIANQVLGSLKNVGKAHKPSLERANFVVLRSPDVPSMLIETGFITNPTEERRLNDAGYRTRLATAITEGVRKYFTGQAPAGSWYAARSPSEETSIGDGQASPLMASSPD